MENLASKVQKIKWNILGLLNPDFYVWSEKDYNKKDVLDNSGFVDFKRFIEQDELLKKEMDFTKSTVLEIGTGVGRITRYLCKYFKHVYSIDISSSMLKKASDNLSGYSNKTLLESDGMTLPVDDESVDFVFSSIVFQHFATKDMVFSNLKESLRVLRPGGIAKIQLRGTKLICRVPAKLTWYYGVHAEIEELQRELAQWGADIVNVENSGKKYMWITFVKRPH